MSLRRPRLVPFLALSAVLTSLACSDDEDTPSGSTGGGGGAGGAVAGQGGAGQAGAGQGGVGGAGAGGVAGTAGSAGAAVEDPKPGPGELCASENPKLRLSASVAAVFVAVGQTRSIEVVAQPDLCSRTAIELKLGDGAKAQIAAIGGVLPATPAAATATGALDLRTPGIKVDVKGVAAGDTTLEASFQLSGKTATLSVPVHVVDTSLPTCTGQAAGQVKPGGQVGGTAALGGASLGLQDRADQPAQVEFEGTTLASPTLWKVEPFDATVSCAAAGIVPAGHQALGPAVTFGPEARRFPREVPMAIPINPALLPDRAQPRHIRIVYSGPAFKAPRVIPVADLQVKPAAEGGGWVASFLAPRLGTYQAVLADDAGTKTFKRRVTHRAIIGISMGGGGTALLGSKHHDMFDVLAPLGGPVDWTFMLNHIEHNHVAGFLPNDGVNPPATLAPMPEPTVPYEHPSTFNQWWYEYPRSGNGGTFDRGAYTQIFRDLSLMFGNPNGDNQFPGGEHLPPGVDPQGKSVKGELSEGDCTIAVESTGKEPNAATLKALEDKCPASRCQNTQVLENFYDGRFNPKGTWPVITVCDGGPQKKDKSPYANQWNDSNAVPFEVGLAVDYNGNGRRDENEPIITQGHEPYRDVGLDGVASTAEPGYQVGVNEDPAGDDYDPQYNPAGTENNGRFEDGEPYDDFGLDGVADTKSSPYDVGEGDGVFTVSRGLQRFWDQDAHSIVRQWATPPAGPLDDKALQRLDLWVDGGYRDLFNFGVAGQHLVGTYAARKRDVAYYSSPVHLPGQDPLKPNNFAAQNMLWNDLPGSVLMRYGQIDPTPGDLNDGAGQHVGTAIELTSRLQAPLFYIARRWPDAPHTLADKSSNDPTPGLPACEISGNCQFNFKDSRGREGPVAVSLPPGYGNVNQKDTRYPVIYMLHGYGQSPEDLSAAIIFLSSWMNQGSDSAATRMAKSILVYVDGRCRLNGDGKPECIRGTFYADSPRADGGKLESWFLDLTGEIDKRYRTMGPSEIDWTE